MTPGQQVAWIRDVPVSCVCDWVWLAGDGWWVRTSNHPHCVWHAA